VKTPDLKSDFKIRPLPKRLRATLLSVLLCVGLTVAWYISTLNEPVPPDAHITYEMTGGFRVDLSADGHVRVSDPERIYTYSVSKFAVRRVLRSFHQAHFMERDVLAYAGACQLTLSENHQKIALRHACDSQAPELRQPIAALETVTRFHAVLKADPIILRDYAVTAKAMR